MKKHTTVFWMSALAVVSLSGAMAQEAPAPNRLPRVPVSQQAILTHRDAVLQSRDINGQAMIVDGAELRIGEVNVRLLGVVSPQLSANFGPQARAALDNLVAGNPVHCQIRDRDHDNHFLATCHTSTNLDPALELLKRGLAVAARGTLSGTELAAPYMGAEQLAQSQKLGLWSVSLTPTAAPTPQPAKIEVAPSLVAPPTVVPVGDVKKDKPMAKQDNEDSKTALPVVSLNAAGPKADVIPSNHSMNFFINYQLLLTGLVMLLTALSICAVLLLQRRMDRRDELKAIAAALRGELMAARALCQGRLKSIMTEADDRAMAWPRIRSTLYQAYVGRIGWLGAELARQVVSLYGQSSDYAAYYQANDDMYGGGMPKRHALQIVVQHIEEVLPKLALIEQTGKRLAVKPQQPRATSSAPALDVSPLPVASISPPATVSEEVDPPSFREKSPPKVERLTSVPLPPEPVKVDVKDETKEEGKKDAVIVTATVSSVDTETVIVKEAPKELPQDTLKDSSKDPIKDVLAALARLSPITPPEKLSKDTDQPNKTTATSSFKESGSTPAPLWETVRKFARDHMSEKSPEMLDEELPDYASLIEEDMSHFSFGESDIDMSEDHDPITHSGSNRRS